jgi:hypothetical protein
VVCKGVVTIKTYKYKLVCDQDLSYFQDMVSNYLNSGWKLQGGIFIGNRAFWQAIYLEEEEKLP